MEYLIAAVLFAMFGVYAYRKGKADGSAPYAGKDLYVRGERGRLQKLEV